MATTKPSNMRLDAETETLIVKLKKHTGGTKTSVIKHAVREYARREGINMGHRTWKPERVDRERITATDLQAEMKQYDGSIQTFHVHIGDSAEAAEVVWLQREGRMGIAWGADATWADVEGFLIGVEMYVNDGAAWTQRN